MRNLACYVKIYDVFQMVSFLATNWNLWYISHALESRSAQKFNILHKVTMHTCSQLSYYLPLYWWDRQMDFNCHWTWATLSLYSYGLKTAVSRDYHWIKTTLPLMSVLLSIWWPALIRMNTVSQVSYDGVVSETKPIWLNYQFLLDHKWT